MGGGGESPNPKRRATVVPEASETDTEADQEANQKVLFDSILSYQDLKGGNLYLLNKSRAQFVSKYDVETVASRVANAWKANLLNKEAAKQILNRASWREKPEVCDIFAEENDTIYTLAPLSQARGSR